MGGFIMKKRAIVGLTLIASLAISSVVSAQEFSDINNHWAKSTIEWGSDHNFVHGYPDGTFKPDRSVSEAEFLAMLINANHPSLYFPTPPIHHWADSFYNYAHEMNYPVNDNSRDQPITRTHVAELISATKGVNLTGDEAIKYLLVNGLAKGKEGAPSVENYHGSDTLTRAEAVAFIQNVLEDGKDLTQSTNPLPSSTNDQETQPINQTSNQTSVIKQPDANSHYLLDADPATQAIVNEFVQSLKTDGNKVTGIIPSIPSDYTMTFRYKDSSDGKWGVRANDKNLSNLKSGDTFEIPYTGQGGRIIFALFQGDIGKNDVIVYVPSLKVQWGAKQ
jgi:hypothetical protein